MKALRFALLSTIALIPAAALAETPTAAVPTPATPSVEVAAPAESGTTTEASPSADAVAQEMSPAEKLAATLTMRSGSIPIAGGKAVVTTTEGFAFLDAGDARKLLVEIYGNPPDAVSDVLGVLVPTSVSVLAQESWFAVITYEEDGHVSDDDAASIDYTQLIADMKTDTAEASKERVKAGYERMELIGWAQQPSYDKAAHKLHWAKELEFGGAKPHTLNYAIRALGRTGVLQVNIVASIEQLKDINPQVPGLLKMVEFSKGQTYADFDEANDPVAAYGLAGLIAGGVAAKAGLFKGLLALLLASKKLLVVLVAGLGGAIWGGVKWLLGRGRERA
jgi:uncharacterized membrane-anchored protein